MTQQKSSINIDQGIYDKFKKYVFEKYNGRLRGVLGYEMEVIIKDKLIAEGYWED